MGQVKVAFDQDKHRYVLNVGLGFFVSEDGQWVITSRRDFEARVLKGKLLAPVGPLRNKEPSKKK